MSSESEIRSSKSETEDCTPGAGSSRCDDLARVQRAKGIVHDGTNAKICSAPATARGHRSAMTLPMAEVGINPLCPGCEAPALTASPQPPGRLLAPD